METTDTAPATALPDDIKLKVHRALQSVPAIGLPGGGMGYGLKPQTDEHLIQIIDHLGQVLGRTLREHELLREDYRKFMADLHTMRRVLGTEPQQEQV